MCRDAVGEKPFGNGLNQGVDKPKATDTVKVHYKGTLLSGKEFDSSYKRGQPAQFPLNRVIPGWTEGVQLMSVGSKIKLFVPPELGYGARGAPGFIPPNSLLIFEVDSRSTTTCARARRAAS